MIIRLLLVFLFAFISVYTSRADQCVDYMVMSNGEEIVQYGIDTTGHWYAITRPFSDQYRLTVDGKDYGVYLDIKQMVFSNDGRRWACFGKTNVDWKVICNDTIIDLQASDIGEILFTPNSEHMIYSWYDGADEIIYWINKKIKVMNRTGRLFSSWGGERFAFLGMRGSMYVLNINGKETTTFDQIIPVGFWTDGSFLYAGKNGNYWEIYYHGEALEDMYQDIYEASVNMNGTVAGFLVRKTMNDATGIILSDNYNEPLVGNAYDWVGEMALHPEVELISYKAQTMNKYVMVLNNTEYFAGQETGRPQFTFDGSEMYFFGCNIDCFVNIGGRKYTLPSSVDLRLNVAMKPGSKTIAYSTGVTMIVQYLETNERFAGNMVDEIIQPIYNWRKGRYETLGRIGNRLYLMTCVV